MTVLLEAEKIAVRRGRRTVVAGVSLTLTAGRALHLAGANGSGKTSLLRVLAGLAAPAAGRVARPAAWSFVPERVRLAPGLRCGEWLQAMRRLRGLASTDWEAAVTASGLDPSVLGRPARQLSKGMLQRIALLEAVQSGCPVLLLDEPFAGLDGDGRDWLARELAARLAGGAAVLVTDHSGAADGRLALSGGLALRDGRCSVTGGADGGARLHVRARHADGRRLSRTVPEPEGDDLLRELLADGWHVEEVRR